MIAQVVLGLIGKVADGFFSSKEEAQKFKNEAAAKILENESDLIKAQRDIIVSEASGHSWLQRNWRPLIMVMFGFIIFNNYILFPYASLFTDKAVLLDTPPDLWDLIKIGLGGYVVGRSGEKIASVIKK